MVKKSRLLKETEQGIKDIQRVLYDKQLKIYPCADCGLLRSEDEGGKIFTVCDICWDKHHSTTKS